MESNDKDTLLHLLEIESTRISTLDSTIFTIKGWTITLVSALIGFAFARANSSSSLPDRALLLLATGVTAIFMLIDIHFRSVQLRHVQTQKNIRCLLIKLSKDRTDTEKHTIWDDIWEGRDTCDHEANNSLSRLYKDYFYTILLYLIMIVGLIYLITVYSV